VRINYWIGKTHLVYQFPQYCLPIYLLLKSILLPPIYAITNIEEMGETLFFKRLKIKLEEGLEDDTSKRK